MLILIVLLSAHLVHPHLIIDITPSNNQVNANQQIAIKILTNSTVSSNALMLNFTTDFTLNNPCLVNSSTSTCTYAMSTSAVTLTFPNAFAANTYYVLTVTVINPNFATNFPLSASVGGVPFTNSGIVTIIAKTITCAMGLSSSYVGDTSIGYFTLSNDALPSNSIITINSSQQTTFSNLFQSNPTCSFGSSNAACTLSSSFGSQYLTINNVPTNANLKLNVSFVNNPPFNSSLMAINLLIQNVDSYNMQVCSFQQATPTLLRTSLAATLQNWNSSVGSSSNVTLTISSYFTPFTTNLLFIYDSNFSINSISPSQTSSAFIQGNSTYLYLSNGVTVGKSLTFTISVRNPSTQQPVNFTFYVIYSNTQFVQIIQTSLTLKTVSLPVSVSLSNNYTMSNSIYNVSLTMPLTLTNGGTLTLSLNYGTIQCSFLGFTQNSGLSVTLCSQTSIALNSSYLGVGIIWFTINVQNYYSVRSDIKISLIISGPSPSNYNIGSGQTTVSLAINNQSFTITNSNTTFAAPTSFSITQNTVSLSTTIQRVFNIALPKDLQITNSTTVVSTNSTSSIVQNYTVSTTNNTIVVSIKGLLNIKISNISNPSKYLGSIQWNFTASDLSGNPSSFVQSSHSPFYTSTISNAIISLSNTVIEDSSVLTLTVIPVLQYFYTPNITVTIPNSLVLSCSNCTIQSSNIFSFIYFAAIMRVTVSINNSASPTNNTLNILISTSTVSFETASLSYSLDPMMYSYMSFQSGFFGEVGTVTFIIIKGPTTPVSLSYSSPSAVLQGSTCVSCNNTQIVLSGIVQYFQTASITLNGTNNGVLYATVIAKVTYICASIQGCRICSNDTGSMVCQQCFNSTYTAFTLLYKNQCLQNCPIATYSNTLTCIPCPTNCQGCNSTACLICNMNYFIYNNTCVTSCPYPLINNATHCIEVPIVCPKNCASCMSSTTCDACDGGYLLLNNVCYSSCPIKYVLNSTGNGCVLFVIPEQTKYFPFVFIISAALLSIALVAIKCYEKRSLVMGNLIAFLAFVEIGSMFMTIIYTMQSNKDLLNQALLFILILSKVLLNIIFLAYFIKVIASQEDFQRWREQQESHQRLYKSLLIISSILSFQTIRIIYSRLMGLRLFFGKFNTALIFKPLNYFTLAHFFTCGFALVFLSVRNIIAANGYRTSTFYSSVQSIILELLLLGCCIVDRKKGYDDQFFQYQVYKVKNQYQSSHIQPIQIEEQAENAGSMHQMINAVESQSKNNPGQIVRNHMWVPKTYQPQYQNIEVQSQLVQEIPDEKNSSKQGLINNKKQNHVAFKRENLFRKKLIDDWRELEKTLPQHMKFMKKNVSKPKEKKRNDWLSSKSKKRLQRSMKKSSSYEHIEVKLPEYPGSIPEKIKQHFYQLTNVKKQKKQQNKQQNKQQDNRRSKDKKQKRYNRQFVKSQKLIQSALIQSKSMTMEVEKDPNSDQYSSQENQDITNIDLQIKEGNSGATSVGVGRYIIPPKKIEKEPPNVFQLEQTFEEEDQNFEEQFSEELDEDLKGNESDKRLNYHQQPLENNQKEKGGKIEFKSNPNLRKKFTVKIEGENKEIKSKKYRTKKRKVNRLTEEVYLQRLVGSSEQRVRPLKNLKMDF